MFGLSARAREEGAEAYWMLKIGTHEECRLYEEYWSIKYSVPQVIWNITKPISTSVFDPAPLYALLGDMDEGPRELLDSLGLSIEQPLMYVGKHQSSGYFVTAARNLVEGLMEVPTFDVNNKWHNAVTEGFTLSRSHYDGEVYSLEVDETHNYIADGIVTHNCYSGADPSIVLRIKGQQHLLETSYRVPSNLLNFAECIAREIHEKIPMHCVSKNPGGEVIGLTDARELSSYFKADESWFFLARNRRFFKYYIDWCHENNLPYRVRDVPYFTNTDTLEFREGKTERWPEDKLEFARQCYKAGTFYNGPDINISTIHAVKGDEADNVVVMSDISRAVASQLDIDEDSEHRVFYVAVTRAKKRLFIMYPQTKMYYPYIL